MRRKSVAVLDIRSSDVTVIVGERGVNNTFVFKAICTREYDGYENGRFLDADRLSEAIFSAVSAVEKTCNEQLRELYVGVPGEFSEVCHKQQFAGFSKRRKIGAKDVSALFESGEEPMEGYRCIRATSIIFVTADNRRVIDPVGLTSASLEGVLAYYYCSNYFEQTMKAIFKDMKISLRFLPAELAMATYLVPSETRDEYAIFLDAGCFSSTASILLGNGVLAQRTFCVGSVHIVCDLMEHFGLPYEAAIALLGRANLFAKEAEVFEFPFQGQIYEIDSAAVVEIVKKGLDDLCELLVNFLDENSEREIDYKPILISGEGIPTIRGALEHVSKRLSRVCELLVPDLPYYNKPSMSSRIALVDMAYEDHVRSGFFGRLSNGYGG